MFSTLGKIHFHIFQWNPVHYFVISTKHKAIKILKNQKQNEVLQVVTLTLSCIEMKATDRKNKSNVIY